MVVNESKKRGKIERPNTIYKLVDLCAKKAGPLVFVLEWDL